MFSWTIKERVWTWSDGYRAFKTAAHMSIYNFLCIMNAEIIESVADKQSLVFQPSSHLMQPLTLPVM